MNSLRTLLLLGALAVASASPVMHQMIFEPTPVPGQLIPIPVPGQLTPGGPLPVTPEPAPLTQVVPPTAAMPTPPGSAPVTVTPGPVVDPAPAVAPVEPTPMPPVVVTIATPGPPVEQLPRITPGPPVEQLPRTTPGPVEPLPRITPPVAPPVEEVIPTPTAVMVPSAAPAASASLAPSPSSAPGVSVVPRSIVPLDASPAPEVSPGPPNADRGAIGELTPSPVAPFDNETAAAAASAVCFPAASTVTLRDGSVKTMEQVQIGDQVHVGSGEFSDVFMFTHKLADTKYRFVQIDTAAGNKITLTAGHYLYLNGKLAAADTARVGDAVTVNDEASSIVSVKSVMGTGLYNPQTVHGDIVVDGVLASTYTTAVHPGLGHALLSPLRAVYERLGFSVNVLERGADALARCMPKGQSVF